MSSSAHLHRLYEAIEALPEGITGELIAGQLHTQPRPAPRHALAASNLGIEVGGHYGRGRGGPGVWWIIDEPELHFVPFEEVLVPDLAGWRRERMPEMPDAAHFEIVPDWICEVLSPATASKDRELKMPAYARHGVAFGWLVDPGRAELEAYRLVDGAWALLGCSSETECVRVAPFEEATFRVGDLWR